MRVVAATLILLGASVGSAQPGALMDREAGVQALDQAGRCARPAAICFAAGARTTVAVETQGTEEKATTTPTRFARAASMAASGAAVASADRNGEWTVDLAAALKRPAWGGNALFMLFDLDDKDALANRQFTALYQTNIKAGPALGARLTLTPDEGFRAGHTYRLRVVQLISGKEILLTEGDFTLL
jgi:hypothetical protein